MKTLLAKLADLEEKIDSWLAAFEALKSENEQLIAKLNEKEEEARGLRQEREVFLQEKQQAREKIAHLIECVDAF